MTDYASPSLPRGVLRVAPLEAISQLDTWEFEVRTKLAVEGHLLGAPEAQVAFIYSVLGSHFKEQFREKAGASLSLCMSGGPVAAISVAPYDFLDYISNSLGEPNRQWRAGQRLIALRQGATVSASSHLLRFETAVYQAGGSSWPDQVKILFLINSLSTTTQRRLDLVAWPTPASATYDAFAQLVRGADSAFISPPQGYPAPAPPSSAGDPMDTSVNALSMTERRKLREEGKCFKCRSLGHRAANCPSVSIQALAPGSATQAARNYLAAAAEVDRLDAWGSVDELDG